MALEHLRPTTRSGIKSLARSMRTPDLTHHEALDAASIQAGFENWSDANRRLEPVARSVGEPAYKAHLIAYWRDFHEKTSGAEEIEISLQRPLSELVRKERALKGHYLGSFQLEGGEYLVDRSLGCWCKGVATGLVESGARSLQFMEASQLRPSRSRRNLRPGGRIIPGRDHLTVWFDPAARKHVLVDEPYGLKGFGPERDAWASHHHRQILKPIWQGMHNPNGGTEAYLIAELGYDLAALSQRLNSLIGKEGSWVRTSRLLKY